MSPEQIVRAWKDEDHAEGLDGAAPPAHPIGRIEIADDALDLAGGVDERTEYLETLGCCQGFTQVDKCDVTAGWPYCTMACLTIFWTTTTVCGAT
jgi:mersacidin/lichenicidin family type 2 lantibiotic